jgi:uncharacterized spore protein YtfJ
MAYIDDVLKNANSTIQNSVRGLFDPLTQTLKDVGFGSGGRNYNYTQGGYDTNAGGYGGTLGGGATWNTIADSDRIGMQGAIERQMALFNNIIPEQINKLNNMKSSIVNDTKTKSDDIDNKLNDIDNEINTLNNELSQYTSLNRDNTQFNINQTRVLREKALADKLINRQNTNIFGG